MANLFKKAKEAAAPATAKGKEKKVRIPINDPGFFDMVKRQAVILEEIKRLTAESELKADEIKEAARLKWGDRFEKSGVNPESVMIESRESDDPNSDVAQFMFIVQDKYKMVSQDDANYLKELFGDDIINENEKYEFNKEMIEKYGEIISTLIENCDQIDAADKYQIITSSVKNEVRKGSIDKMAILAKNTDKSVNEVIDILKPVCMAKGVEYIKATAVY